MSRLRCGTSRVLVFVVFGVAAFLLLWLVVAPPGPVVRRLAGAALVRDGHLTVQLHAPAVFFHPGTPIAAPVNGTVLFLASAGPVVAGQVIAVLIPTGGTSASSGASPAVASALCAWQSCREAWRAVPARSGIRLGPLIPRPTKPESVAAVSVQAQSAGWFFPGSSILDSLSTGAIADLTSAVLPSAAVVSPNSGAQWSTGMPLGVFAATWQGAWLALLPAADALVPGQSVQVKMGDQRLTATVAATGRPCGVQRVVELVADQEVSSGHGAAEGDVTVVWRTPRLPLVPRSSVAPLTACASDGRFESAHVAGWSPASAPQWATVGLMAEAGGDAALAVMPTHWSAVFLRASWFPFWVR